MKTIDDYLKDVTPAQREKLEHIRKFIHATVPDIQETISWDMPTFKYKQKNLIHFAAFKEHMSIFPGPEPIDSFKDELKDFTVSKGTIQFTEEKPLPDPLLKKILKRGIERIDN